MLSSTHRGTCLEKAITNDRSDRSKLLAIESGGKDRGALHAQQYIIDTSRHMLKKEHI